VSQQQLDMDGWWCCPTCEGKATVVDHDTGVRRACRVCEGTGVVPFDPEDTSFGF
jgi:hypothetical protein